MKRSGADFVPDLGNRSPRPVTEFHLGQLQQFGARCGSQCRREKVGRLPGTLQRRDKPGRIARQHRRYRLQAVIRLQDRWVAWRHMAGSLVHRRMPYEIEVPCCGLVCHAASVPASAAQQISMMISARMIVAPITSPVSPSTCRVASLPR